MPDAAAIQRAFVKNRAEEIGYDVWEHFAVPPFYDRLDLADAKKPRIITGGRGCGKTMLLRYLSHTSTFSEKRKSIPRSALDHIGLYWRADTQFAAAMQGRGISEELWLSAFNHLLAVTVGLEVLGSLRSIASSNLDNVFPMDPANIPLPTLSAYFATAPQSLTHLTALLESGLRQLRMWVNNVATMTTPPFLPGPAFVLDLIKAIQSHVPALSESVYFVYLDEYENLSIQQQRFVNTCLKHSEKPLIFNLAMKRNAFTTRETLGSESLMEMADFRQHNLEDYLQEDFETFAAEILFLNVATASAEGLPLDVAVLHDPQRLSERRTEEYKKKILRAAEDLFPEVPQKELASIAIADSAIRRSLGERVSQALKMRGSTLPGSAFFDSAFPEASIVAPALLHRRGLEPSSVASEFQSLQRGEPNRFTGPTNWIHNNFIGCLLHLYEPHSRTCPFYAGFGTFCRLARGNIRHLLELCHKSINRATSSQRMTSIPPIQQAEAARQASADFLKEVRSFGRSGNQLHAFVLRLGSVLALAHSRPSQSEPEPSHFSIRQRLLQLAPIDIDFINEAIKWSVLFEEEETKQKDEISQSAMEYVLNPIYAPYFRITYRKRRRLEISAEDFAVLSRGTYEDVRSLLRRLTDAWSVDLNSTNETLFSHLRGAGGETT